MTKLWEFLAKKMFFFPPRATAEQDEMFKLLKKIYIAGLPPLLELLQSIEIAECFEVNP